MVAPSFPLSSRPSARRGRRSGYRDWWREETCHLGSRNAISRPRRRKESGGNLGGLRFHSLDFPSIPWRDMEQAALLAAAPSRPVTLVAAPRCFLFVQPKSSCVEASFVFLSTTQIQGGECTSVSLKPCLSWYKTGREETRVVPLPSRSIASQPSKEWTQIH